VLTVRARFTLAFVERSYSLMGAPCWVRARDKREHGSSQHSVTSRITSRASMAYSRAGDLRDPRESGREGVAREIGGRLVEQSQQQQSTMRRASQNHIQQTDHRKHQKQCDLGILPRVSASPSFSC
jgi:hypothetical protein